MASSDEEGEIFPDGVTAYEFLNQENEQISFAFLPLQWRNDEPPDSVNLRVFLSGVCDNGLQRIYKQVVAWRYELSYAQPEISVLCKGNLWVKLFKPKKLFEAAIRSILITIQCLHFVKHNPQATKNSIWCHLSRVFSTYEVAPSEVDIMNHISLIRNAAERDRTLKNSEYMLGILLEKPTKGKVLQMEGVPVKRADFIVDETMDDPYELDDSADNDDLFDTCCSLCDNGGDILCCEGRCMRSFHATEASGEGLCDSLGLSAAQVYAIQNFICKNCRYQKHQCFICRKLGSSDMSSNPEVFPCVAANCGRFYHPRCISKKLHQQNYTLMEDLEKKIAAGESFVCPSHKCFVCKQVEDREIDDLQFAVCRRCPKSYHRKCLPREISFEGDDENLQRAWDGLLLKRILIYCLDHEIDPELGTPLRNHITFPGFFEEKKRVSEQPLTRVDILPKKRKPIPYHSATETLEHKTLKHPSFVAQKNASLISLPSALRSKTAPDKSKQKPFKSYVMQPGNAAISAKKPSAVHLTKPLLENQRCSSSIADVALERRILALMENVNSSFDVDEFKKQQIVPSNYRTSQITLDKTLTKVKVEVTVKAIRTAVQKLDNGGTVEDAKSVCSAEMLRQIPLWKKRLDVYLAPFLHGMSYSSYGRHFTKPEKLQEIVERLHWFVQDGDMIVDFCCGSNDFSCMMKKKMDTVGKKCRFKNYDLFPAKEILISSMLWGYHLATESSYAERYKSRARDGCYDLISEPDARLLVQKAKSICLTTNLFHVVKKKCSSKRRKNDFNFEQRDWFSVQPKELPEGSQLIMGMNPPFGYKASLANQFINKALQFRPKLIVLIVPPETRRLDSRYDLIWEDPNLLAGESFYLPGSCDTDDKQLSQWNKITPPLYLWSRSDWTRKHREIASRCGQIRIPNQPPCSRPPAWNYLLEEQHDCYGDFSNLMNEYRNLPSMLDDVPEHNDNHELSGHKFNGNFVTCNVNSSNLRSFENPRTTNVARQLQTDVSFPPVDDLVDMDISPTDSPSHFLAGL